MYEKLIDPSLLGVPTYREPPHNEEAEQTILGAVLVNNRAIERVEGLRPEHFFDPANQKIFQAIQRMIDAGQVANPITLKAFFERDRDLTEIGGTEYIAKLAAAIVSVHNLQDYATVVRECYTRRQMIEIAEDACNAAYDHKQGITATDLLSATEDRLFRLGDEGTDGAEPVSMQVISQQYLAELQTAWKHKGEVTGITTGLIDLDKLICGLQPTDLVIVAGRPAMGKTALAVNGMGLAAAQSGKEVLILSYEMGGSQLLGRMVASRTGLDTTRQRGGRFGEAEWVEAQRASQEIAALPIHIQENAPKSMSAIRSMARRHKRKRGLSLLIIDYLQLMSEQAPGGRGFNRVEELSVITRGLKSIARELRVPVLALSQLSRQVESREDKRPMLSDLRESGSIEQDADVVMMLFREQYYLEKAEPQRRADESNEKFNDRSQQWVDRLGQVHGMGEIIIAKNRHGPTATVKVAWDGPRQLFGNLAQQPDNW